jgi:hypothetical protein
MYVPAVLRPTEKPVKQSPPKRGQGEASEPEDGTQEDADTSSVRRIVTEEWNETRLEDVTGPPSRNHWKVSRYSLSFFVIHLPCPVYAENFLLQRGFWRPLGHPETITTIALNWRGLETNIGRKHSDDTGYTESHTIARVRIAGLSISPSLGSLA